MHAVSERCCYNCAFWKQDFGMWCVNGWSKMGRDEGDCHLEPRTVAKRGDDLCQHFTSHAEAANGR